MNNDQKANNEAKCCIEYCSATFIVEDKEIVSSYRCNQKPFTASDMLDIQKQRKRFTIDSNPFLQVS